MTIHRTYNKTVLIDTLKPVIEAIIPNVLININSTEDHATLVLSRELTPQEDIDVQDAVNANLPTDSFLEEKALTDRRNAEGFDLYKRIFAHISDNDAVSDIDGFIAASDYIHKLRNFLKDGNFETALRYFYKYVRPLNMFQHQELYRGWITEYVLKYKPELGFINPDFDGSPYEGWTTIRYIEEAANA
jgi:hypothetical protein